LLSSPAAVLAEPGNGNVKDTVKAMANRDLRATRARIPVVMIGAVAQASIEGVF
jgi:hypothetical protein